MARGEPDRGDHAASGSSFGFETYEPSRRCQHQRGCWLVSAPKKCWRSRARIAARAKNLPVGGTRISLHWRRADARGTSGLRVRRAVLSRSRRSLGEDRPRASRRTSAPLVWFRASDRSRGRDGFFPGSPTRGWAGGGDVQADARDVGVLGGPARSRDGDDVGVGRQGAPRRGQLLHVYVPPRRPR